MGKSKQQKRKEISSQSSIDEPVTPKSPPDLSASAKTLSPFSKLEDQLSMIAAKLDNMVTGEQLEVKLNNTETQIVAKLNTLIEKQDSRIFQLETENENLKEEVQQLAYELGKNQDEITKLNRKLDHSLSAQNDLEQYSRLESIRIYGIEGDRKTESSEECIGKVIRTLNDKLEMKLSSRDINIAHRLGRINTETDAKPRGIIVKFMSRRSKIECIQKRRVLKGSKIVIKEDLTPQNQLLLKTTASHPLVISAWSRDGKIFAKNSNEQIRQVKSMKCLEELAKKKTSSNGAPEVPSYTINDLTDSRDISSMAT